MTPSILGIDIGGTYIKYGVFTAKSMKPKMIDRTPTAKNLPDFVTQLLDIVHNQSRPHALAAVGIGVPAFISKKENRIEMAPNLKYLQDVHLQREIGARTYLPVIVGNDANLAALGEYHSLPKPLPHAFVHLTLGTGVGSGIILNHHLWLGECGFAGELGHVPVNTDGRACSCGSRGCLETEASERGIVRSFREFSKNNKATTSRDVYELFLKRNSAARKAFQRAGHFLGIMFSVIANTLNPAVITVGGGVAACGDAILDPALEEFHKRTFKKNCQCTLITLGRKLNDAGVIGAAYLARSLMK